MAGDERRAAHKEAAVAVGGLSRLVSEQLEDGERGLFHRPLLRDHALEERRDVDEGRHRLPGVQLGEQAGSDDVGAHCSMKNVVVRKGHCASKKKEKSRCLFLNLNLN